MYYIHVNGQRIKANKRYGRTDPPVRFQKGKHGKPTYCNRLKFTSGEIMYEPYGDPLTKCGARLVICTNEEPRVID